MTFVVAILIGIWGTDIHQSIIKKQETDVEKLGLVNYDVYYKDSNCSVAGEKCYRMLFVNNEDFSMRFVIVTHTDLGNHVSGPGGYELGPYEQKLLNISYPSNLGDKGIYAEVDAVKI
jgi:hypothetical protein